MKTPEHDRSDDVDPADSADPAASADSADRRPWDARDPADSSDPVIARVRFAFPAALRADRSAHGKLVEALEGGAAVREFRVHRVHPFLLWVLSYAGEAVVEGPDELVRLYQELAAGAGIESPEVPAGDRS